MRNNIANVLFDLDGTLVDTAPDLASALNQTLVQHAKEPLPFEMIRPSVSLGGAALVKLGFGLGENDPDFIPMRDEFLGIYRDNLSTHSRLFPGMGLVLDRLEQTGMPWGIVTNKPAWLTDPLTQALQLDSRTPCIVSGDTLEHRKPHPAPLLHACKLLQCEPHASVYIGDDRRDISAGTSAGMATLVASYGYIATNEQPENWGADGFIDNPEDILDWLRVGGR